MLKAKLLTFHNAENYGAMLQAYALKNTLKNEGYGVQFINYQDKNILKDYKLIRFNSFKSFFSSIFFIFRNVKRKISFKKFSDKYLDTKLKKYYTNEQIEKDISKENILIAGSDQIWNVNLTCTLSDIYTLNFNNCKNKLIYGASVGNEELIDVYKDSFVEKLKDVEYISVRESNVKEKLENILNKSVECVLDPTLLLSKTDWNNLLEESKFVNPIKEDYILVYTLFESEKVTLAANKLSEITGLKVVHFRKYNAYKNELKSLYTYGPTEFVNAFKNAKYVITNSFHGTVFSIIYNKKFSAILPCERKKRIEELLYALDIQDRILDDNKDINKILDEIDYDSVNNKLEGLKTKSINYLKKGIKCQEENN